VNLLGHRRILDQFDQLVSVDNLSRRDRQIFSNLESTGVGDFDLPGVDIAYEILHAFHQVLTAARNGLMDHLRIGEGKVGRADSIQLLAQEEGQLVSMFFIQTFDPGGCLE
jgi:hypothetical protein